MNRRQFSCVMTGLAMPWPTRAAGPSLPADALAGAAVDWAALERQSGGKLGVAVWQPGWARPLGHRLDERFPMCSSFKWLLGAWALQQAARGQLSMAERLRVTRGDVVAHSPITAAQVGGRGLSLAQLCEAMITTSDNAAANLVLRRLGGPAAYTRFARELGDTGTRLDRDEPRLNSAQAGDAGDTTTPRGMAQSLRAALLEDAALPPAQRRQLRDWMVASRTGLDRLRAGLPAGWLVGDKTGTCDAGSVNDVAVAWPPQGAPRVIVAYLHGGTAPMAQLKAALAEVGRRAATLAA